MFEELKELICEYVDVNPSDIKEESRLKTVKDAVEYIRSLQD